MRMLDPERKISVCNLQLYLTPKEAEQLKKDLAELLGNPEANEHFHLFSEDMSRELSCSLVTKEKLKHISRYTKLERQILTEK